MKSLKIPFQLYIPLLILVGFLIRIPILTDPALLIDGDEAVIGLMANDWLTNGTFPTYFIGQQYGLSTLEACSAGVFFTLFGMTDWALKLSSLSIWLVGIIFFYKALIQFKPDKKQLAFVVSLILVTAPTWLYWAMKSRGGYISAFTFSAILLFLISKQNGTWSNPRAIAIGACFALISQFHSLWFISILPICIFFILKREQLVKLKFIAIGFTGILFPLFLIKLKQPSFWNPNLLRFENAPFPWISNLPNTVLHHFSGTYYLGSLKETKIAALVFSTVIIFFIIIALIYQLSKSVKTKSWYNLNNLLLLSIYANIAITLFLIPGARYLLPVLAIVLILFFKLLVELKQISLLGPLLILTLSISASLSKPFSKDSDTYKFETQLTKASMTKLIEDLKTENISNIFVLNGMGQYQIMFYGKGEINARYVHEVDRMPNRIEAVAKAFNNQEKTAFILLKAQDRQHFSESKMKHLTKTVSLVINPTIQELKIFHFETSDLK